MTGALLFHFLDMLTTRASPDVTSRDISLKCLLQISLRTEFLQLFTRPFNSFACFLKAFSFGNTMGRILYSDTSADEDNWSRNHIR